METTLKRRSPRTRSREPKRIELTPRDIELFKLLNRYRYLRSTFIEAFLGGNSMALRWRLRDLFDCGYLARPDQQWQYVNARYMPTIYELDTKGEAILGDYGLYSTFTRVTVRPSRTAPHHQFAHDLMVCDILASIELGVIADKTLRFIPVQEILAKSGEATQKAKSPLTITIGDERLTPDALFGIAYLQGVRFYALEADRATEPLYRHTSEGSDYKRKLDMYDVVYKDGIYKKHWGLPNLLVLHVTTSPTRMTNIMGLAGASNRNLYKTLSTLGDYMKAPEPSPHMLTKAWARLGHPEFHLNR